MLTLNRDALHAAILANPADDLPRLAYADWLEEYGDDEAQVRARFIRVQLQLANCGRYCPYDKLKWPCECEFCTLTREEGYILGDWPTGEPFDRFASWTEGLRHILGMRVREATTDLGIPPSGFIAARFRRGFLADLVCHPQQWFDHHAKILSLYPLERVAFTTSPPAEIHWSNHHDDDGQPLITVRMTGNYGVYRDVLPADVVATIGEAAAIEETKMRICHQAWPRIAFCVCRGE